MKLSRFEKKKRALANKGLALEQAESRVSDAISMSKHTGLIGSRSVFDDPTVRAAMKHRDRILRDIDRIKRRWPAR